MNIRLRLERFFGGCDLVVIIKCPDGQRTCGKFVVGRHSQDGRLVALVLDSEMTVHPAIAKKYRLVAIGGGYFDIDHDDVMLRISGRSEAYGAEPDRRMTSAALEAALPTYRVVID